MFPFHHLDAASNGIGNAIMFDSANQLTQPAAGTFFVIYGEDFLVLSIIFSFPK